MATIDEYERVKRRDMNNELARLARENECLTIQLKQAREIIWMNHGHIELYGDDGEMQCRSFDFKRATWIEIWDHLNPAGAPIRAAIAANPAPTTVPTTESEQ